jgi:glycosyltransferase involved in cell wall biosynthesis
MKIGVDARLLSRPLTGIGRYTLEMCRALSQIPEVSLFLYSPSSIQDVVRRKFSSAQFRTMNFKNGMLRQLWSESFLPLWAKMDAVDIFWGPAHRLPHFLPKAIPRVVTIHDLVWKYAGETMRRPTYFLEKIQMPLAVRAADSIVADSQATANAVKLEFGIDADNLMVVSLAGNSVKNVASFDDLSAQGINGSYFLFVGTLEPRKNLTRLLTAYSLLPKAVKLQTSMVIAGGKGWGKVNLEDTIARLDLDGYVKVLGYVDEPKLAALYAHAKFLAMPSLYEGFGLPLVEAMMHGTPVLTANNSSMPEVAGDAGLLVDAQDINSIRDGLMNLLSDEVLRNKLGNNAIIQAIKFNWDDSARQLVSAFNDVISRRKSLS